MDKKNVVYVCKGTLFSQKEEQNPIICDNTDDWRTLDEME
jgi:hypothetical protein